MPMINRQKYKYQYLRVSYWPFVPGVVIRRINVEGMTKKQVKKLEADILMEYSSSEFHICYEHTKTKRNEK